MANILKNFRTRSSVEYMQKANEIYSQSCAFLLRLSSRYSRLFSGEVILQANALVDSTIGVYNAFPSNSVRAEERERELLAARKALRCLENALGKVYIIIAQNPLGSFVNKDEKVVSKEEAEEKIDKMAVNLGCLIDEEDKILTGELGKLTTIKNKLKKEGK